MAKGQAHTSKVRAEAIGEADVMSYMRNQEMPLAFDFGHGGLQQHFNQSRQREVRANQLVRSWLRRSNSEYKASLVTLMH
jgi:hypothetical protein